MNQHPFGAKAAAVRQGGFSGLTPADAARPGCALLDEHCDSFVALEPDGSIATMPPLL